MTSLLERALRKAARLPEAEQDRIAQVILDDIEDEAHWQASFARSQDRLAALASAAREETARSESGITTRRPHPNEIPDHRATNANWADAGGTTFLASPAGVLRKWPRPE